MRGAIIYVSSNRENPDFEKRVYSNMLKKKGNLPVYSVSHKPLSLGTNMVVGDVGVSGFNFCRQLQKACQMTDADYVISCEDDCLYPPDYFTFVPPRPGLVWRNTNNYIIPYKKDVYWYKKSQTAFQIADRKVLLNRLDYLLYGHPEWNTKMFSFPKEIGKPFLESWNEFETQYACLTIKTGDGMRKYSNSVKSDTCELPYWGYASEVRRRYEN